MRGCPSGLLGEPQTPSLRRAARGKGRQTRDRSPQGADLGLRAGQVEAPDGRKRSQGTMNGNGFVQSEH